MSCATREMTLVEYVSKLPRHHAAREQFHDLLSRVDMTAEEAQMAYEDSSFDESGFLRCIIDRLDARLSELGNET